MADNKFEIKIRGRRGDGDLIRLDDFADELSAIYQVLKKLDRLVSRKHKPTMFFEITKIRYTSPPVVEIAAIPEEPTVNFTTDVGRRFVSGISDIQKGIIPHDYDAGLVNDFKNIGASTKKGNAEIDVKFADETTTIKSPLDEIIEEVLGGDQITDGSISGILESINLHGGKNEFRIYPIAGPTSIVCRFPTDLRQSAVDAVDQHVTVFGRMKYRPREKFPYSVDIKNIDIHPPDEELPSFYDLRGIAPNATGGLSSEDFIKRIRGDGE